MLELINWTTIGSLMYTYWEVLASLIMVSGFVFKAPIIKHWKRLLHALQSADQQVRKIETLTARLQSEEERATDWRTRFDEMEARYDALNTEWQRLGQDLKDFEHRMSASEALIKDLKHDRDALMDFSRLLVGQMFAHGVTPDYPQPALQSILAVPGPQPKAQP